MEDVTFQSANLLLHGRLHKVPSSTKGVVFLHGGGKASYKRYAPFQSDQAQFGQQISSLAFNFRGCPPSEGNFEDGSLQNRSTDAENAIAFFLKQTGLPISYLLLWGSSMGGHIACRLLEKYPVAGIVLQSAAAYSQQAENVPLNDKFTQIISQPNNWTSSPAFSALEKCNGKILVIYGEHDTVVPKDIQQRYSDIAKSKEGQMEIIKNCGHSLLNPKTETEKDGLNELVNRSASFILSL